MHRDDDYWSKKNFDDWITRRPGTLMGDEARKHDRIFQPKPSLGGTSGSTRVDRLSTSAEKGFFPGVDDWFDRNFSVKARQRVALVLLLAGAMVGLGVAPQLGMSAGVAALIGAVAGVMFVPLLILTAKLVLLVLIVGVMGLCAYFVYLLALN